MIIVLLADGFEEIEALTPVDMLRRAKLSVKTVGISGRTATGAHGISVICDLLPEDVDLKAVDMLILPGGMPGTLNLDASPFTDEAIWATLNNGGRIAAICAAPIILGRRGLLKGRMATCYPGFENELSNAHITNAGVVTDGNITTARGMGVALEFAEELIALTLGNNKAKKISRAICKKSDGDDISIEEDGVENIKYHGDEADEAAPDFSGYELPTAELLNEDKPFEADTAEVEEMAETIISFLTKFKLNVNIVGVEYGVRVTRFILTTDNKTPVNKILNLEDDLTIALGTDRIRIVAPIPGQNAIGVEVPNRKAGMVRLRGVIESEEYRSNTSVTSVCLGRGIGGDAVISDIAKMPHMIVSGATGMGKSVAISSMLTSLLLKARPEQLKLIMIDPKQVEFTAYQGLPHLLCPVIHNPDVAAAVLEWTVNEMERRYELMTKTGTRNIDDYNKSIEAENGKQEKLPFILIVIDEFADLMMMKKDPIEMQVIRLAQKARAAGIHLIIGTQRPTPSVISPLIKANVPARLCCKVMSAVDSKTILDVSGAERLLDKGDALYFPTGASNPVRLQCAYISDVELERITDAAKSIGNGVGYDPRITEYVKNYIFILKNPLLFDQRFLDAVEVALSTGKISTSLIQRRLSVGYGKAAEFIDLMEELGIVSEMNGQRPRDVLMTRDDWRKKLSKLIKDKK